jgi:hypothetical protein
MGLYREVCARATAGVRLDLAVLAFAPEMTESPVVVRVMADDTTCRGAGRCAFSVRSAPPPDLEVRSASRDRQPRTARGA